MNKQKQIGYGGLIIHHESILRGIYQLTHSVIHHLLLRYKIYLGIGGSLTLGDDPIYMGGCLVLFGLVEWMRHV